MATPTERVQAHRAKYPEKYAARTALTHAVRDGRLAKLPCEVCGEPKVQAHHEDYSKPLEVRWLCKSHHIEAHGGALKQSSGNAKPRNTDRHAPGYMAAYLREHRKKKKQKIE